MKITKKSQKVNSNFSIPAKPAITDEDAVLDNDHKHCCKTTACDKILEAIEALSEDAKDDDICRDAISDLSVVYFCLK